MNTALLAREAAASIGSLDPQPEPIIAFSQPTRLLRVVENEVEIWLDPMTGRQIDDRG